MNSRKATLSLVLVFVVGYLAFAVGAYAKLGSLVDTGRPTVEKKEIPQYSATGIMLFGKKGL